MENPEQNSSSGMESSFWHAAAVQWLVPFTVRDFQPADFDTLWNIDQTCFAPGISYREPN